MDGSKEEVNKSEKWYRTLFEQAGDACFLLEKYKIIECNLKTLEMFNAKSKKQIIGKTPFDLSPEYQPDDNLSETQAKIIMDMVFSGTDKTFNWKHCRLDGSLIDVSVSLSKVTIDDNDYLMGLLRDITEQKIAEKALKESEDRFRILVEKSFDGIFIHKDFRIVFANNHFSRMLGLSEKEILGKDPIELLAPDSKEKVRKYIAEGTGDIFHIQYMNRKNNNLIDVNAVGGPCFYQGEEARIVAIEDITEKKRMDELIIQNEKIISIGGLAAGMAHEINNPLGGIVQSASVITNRLCKSLESTSNVKAAEEAGITLKGLRDFLEKRDIFKMLNSINNSARRVTEIIDNMLSFSRKSDGSLTYENIEVLLNKTLDLTNSDFNLKKGYDFRNIKIFKEYKKKLPLVLCESSKIQQVLLNILRNGAQAMKEAEISYPQFTIRLYSTDREQTVSIEIEDNGPGMSADVKKRVFDPFFTTKPEGEGTGLGLSVSYFIITKNHNGSMTIETEEGRGTNFIIKLPLQLPE